MDVGVVIALIITGVLLGIPTYIVYKVIKKCDADSTVYTPEEISKRLRRGFYLCFWGIEFAFGSLALFLLWIFDYVPTTLQIGIPIGSIVIGFILLFVGRVKIGTATRFLNHRKRELTPLEEWTLTAMYRVEGWNSAYQNLINSITRTTPGVTDDILLGIGNVEIITGFFGVGKVYTGKSHLKKYWPVYSIIATLLIFLVITLL